MAKQAYNPLSKLGFNFTADKTVITPFEFFIPLIDDSMKSILLNVQSFEPFEDIPNDFYGFKTTITEANAVYVIDKTSMGPVFDGQWGIIAFARNPETGAFLFNAGDTLIFAHSSIDYNSPGRLSFEDVFQNYQLYGLSKIQNNSMCIVSFLDVDGEILPFLSYTSDYMGEA
jgi:hypothetical protein